MVKKSVVTLILGIVALEVCFIPFWSVIALPCAIIALIYAGKVRAYALESGDSWNMARIGRILSIVALVGFGLTLLFWTALFAAGIAGIVEHGDEIVFALQDFIDQLMYELRIGGYTFHIG